MQKSATQVRLTVMFSSDGAIDRGLRNEDLDMEIESKVLGSALR